MKFINFKQNSLTPEQVEAAKAMGATKIVDAKSVLANFSEIANDDGNTDSIAHAQRIAEAIAALSSKEQAVVHFPISSPRVQAAFWRLHEYWKYFIFENAEYELWKQVRKCRFVFSHTARVSQDVPQADGSVKKTTVFKFEKFVKA